MRVLIVSPSSEASGEASSPEALVRDLSAAGAEARWVEPGRALLGAVSRRPQVAHVLVGPATWAVPKLLAGMRIPVVLEVPESPFEPSSHSPDSSNRSMLRREVRRQRLQSVARSCRALIVPRAQVRQQLEAELGIRGIRVVADGPAAEPVLDRNRAKSELGLLPNARFLALTAPLEGLELDALAPVHRRLPGVGLLVVGDGPQERLVEAMSLATRPSSPVVRLRADARPLAVAAAEVGLSLRRPAGTESWSYAAAGRRQVAVDPQVAVRLEPLLPDQQAVFEPESAGGMQGAIEAALAAELERGPMDPGLVDRARGELGVGPRVQQLVKLYGEIAGSER